MSADEFAYRLTLEEERAIEARMVEEAVRIFRLPVEPKPGWTVGPQAVRPGRAEAVRLICRAGFWAIGCTEADLTRNEVEPWRDRAVSVFEEWKGIADRLAVREAAAAEAARLRHLSDGATEDTRRDVQGAFPVSLGGELPLWGGLDGFERWQSAGGLAVTVNVDGCEVVR